MSKNKKLNFDLDSLDQNSEEFETERTKLNSLVEDQVRLREKNTKKTSGGNSSCGWIIAVIVIGFIIWIASSSSSSDQTVKVSGYNCSQSDANTANGMAPSSTEGTWIETESNRLDALNNKIKTSTVTTYSSQFLIDLYNADVNSYNASAPVYNARRDKFNSSVDAYNSFLNSHCSKN